MSRAIDEFAELLVRQVRDEAIDSCDRRRRTDARGPVAKRWREAAQAPDQLLHVAIPDCIDDALFYLLDAVDNGVIKLSFTSSEGETVDLTEAGRGELAGWYMGGGEGWRMRYSRERYADDT